MGLNYSKFIENRIKNIQASDSFAFASAIGVGPWVVPLGPAIIFGYALYKSAPADMAEFRVVAAVAVAIGLIVAGAISSHTAITGEKRSLWLLVIGYIALEIIGLWAMSVSGDIKIVGTVASLLTLIVYLSRASAKKLEETKAEKKAGQQLKIDYQLEQARLKAEHEREMAMRLAELEHAQTLAKIEASKEKAIAKTTVQKSVQTSVESGAQNGSTETPQDTQKAIILSHFQQNPKTKITHLSEQLGITRNTVYSRINTLADEGKLKKNGAGYIVTNGNPDQS